LVRSVCEMVDAELRRVAAAGPGGAKQGGGAPPVGSDLDALWQKYSVGLADTLVFVEERQKVARQRQLQQGSRVSEDVAAVMYNLGEKAEPERKPTVKNPMKFVGSKIVWNRSRRAKAVALIINGNNKRVRGEGGSADAGDVLADQILMADGVAGSAKTEDDSRLAVVTIALTPLRHDTQAIDSFHFFSIAGAEETSSGAQSDPSMRRLCTQIATELICSVVKDTAAPGGVSVQWQMKCDPLHCLVR
jgi:hypothetical protein